MVATVEAEGLAFQADQPFGGGAEGAHQAGHGLGPGGERPLLRRPGRCRQVIAKALLDLAQSLAQVGEQAAMRPRHLEAAPRGEVGVTAAPDPAFVLRAPPQGSFREAVTLGDFGQIELAQAIVPLDAAPIDGSVAHRYAFRGL